MSKTKSEAFEIAAKTAMYSFDTDTVSAFFLGFSEYCPKGYSLVPYWTSEFEKVVEKDLARGGSSRATNESHPEKLLRFLSIWLGSYPRDFTTAEVDTLKGKIKPHRKRYTNAKTVFKFIETFEEPKENEIKKEREAISLNFMSFTAKEFARELTRHDWDIFHRITGRELVTDDSPNLSRFTDRFNAISFWAATEVVVSNALHRPKVIKLLIDIAHVLLKQNNFQSSMAVLSGLSNSSIERLSSAWTALPPGSMKKFKSLENVFDPAGNFKNYNALLKKASLPVIPYVPLVLRALTFIKDGNPPYLESGRINFDRLLLLQESFSELNRYQDKPFRLPPGKKNLVDFCGNLPYLEEDEIYSLSLHAQPSKIEPVPPLSIERIRAENEFLFNSRSGTARSTSEIEQSRDSATSSQWSLGGRSDHGSETDESESSAAPTDYVLNEPRDVKKVSMTKAQSATGVPISCTLPSGLRGDFELPEKRVHSFFSKIAAEKMKSNGQIKTRHHRFAYIPATSFFTSAYRSFHELGGKSVKDELAGEMMEQMGRNYGKSEARMIQNFCGLDDPKMLLAAWPLFLAHSGLAYVDVKEMFATSDSRKFFVEFCTPRNVEKEAWKEDKASPSPKSSTSQFIRGFSSGWADVAYPDLKVVCVQFPGGRFIMSSSEHLKDHLKEFCTEEGVDMASIDIPSEEKRTVGLKRIQAWSKKKLKQCAPHSTWETVLKKDPAALKSSMKISRSAFKKIMNTKEIDPYNGIVSIYGESFLLVRTGWIAPTMFTSFISEHIENDKLCKIFTLNVLFDLGINVGTQLHSIIQSAVASPTDDNLLYMFGLCTIFQGLGWGKSKIKFTTSSFSKAKAYSFIYCVNDVIEEHSEWTKEEEKFSNFCQRPCIFTSGAISGYVGSVCPSDSVSALEICCSALFEHPTCDFVVCPGTALSELVRARLKGESKKVYRYSIVRRGLGTVERVIAS